MTAQQSSTANRLFAPRRLAILAALLAVGAALLPAASARAAEPAWQLSLAPIGGLTFPPGAHGNPADGPGFQLTATNSGDGPTTGPYTITDTLPEGLLPATGISAEDQNGNALGCNSAGLVVTCTGSSPLGAGEKVEMTLPVDVKEGASGKVEDKAVVEGGGSGGFGTASIFVRLSFGHPAWSIYLTSEPTRLVPSSSPHAEHNEYYFNVSNIGGAYTEGPITFTLTMAPGMTAPFALIVSLAEYGTCAEGSPNPEDVTCTITESIAPGEIVTGIVFVDTGALTEGTSVSTQLTVSGGGAVETQATTTTTISEEPSPFDFGLDTAGLSSQLIEEDGLPATQAGSHPDELALQVGFTSVPGNTLNNGSGGFVAAAEGGARDVGVTLPRGVVVNPNSSPKLCTEAQIETSACPGESAIGLADLQSNFGLNPTTFQSPLYNIVPPPGSASSFSFNAAGAGIYPHILGGVHPGDYALSAVSDDILQIFNQPFFGLRTELWGDPSSPNHDFKRGKCGTVVGSVECPVPRQSTPLLTMPTSCPSSLTLEAEADSWGNPGVFHHRGAEATDVFGNPIGVTGCNALDFSPTLKARPTTNVADSPSGLEVDLHIPQSEGFNTLAEAHLRKAVVTLPPGLVVNPASGNGLQGCSSAQIGINPATGVANGNEPTCPDAAKIGSVQVDTQLLNHPVPGAVYLATPHDNPFDSLLAIYVVVDDPQSGVLIKLAGHVEADPQTGRLTTTFDNNPQLPFSDFKLNFFGGAGAALRTPATCGAYSTTSSLTPWSAPESGPPATPSDSYEISQSPAGGACPTSTAAQPNTPSFDAGTVTPVAGAYSPMVINLRRADGSQQFSAVTVTPPPGLLGKLAGTPYCPDAALAAAATKTGNQEKASPSCPAASQVGSADVAAGAGPAPYHTQGKVYLAGPYKGAPLSVAIVTPATAGPYDLGTVVVRTALNVNPETAQITAVSDPIPSILQGIPLDVRSALIKLDKPSFTLNPTSCAPLSFGGQLVSTLGQVAPLSSRFQVGECANLGFKPTLALRLNGSTKRSGHPALKATLTYPSKGAYANIAKASVALPHSEFLDQSHIGTVCTRPQFAAGQCPAASIYGHAKATTPLLDAPLEGPVYLRSSSHELPDLVADLNGQIHVALAGRIDTVKGGIRNTFEAVPDAPVSTFVLEMQGGSKGLLVNSTNLCKSENRATALFDGQNGKTYDTKPLLQNKCPKKKAKKHKRHRRVAR